MSQPTSTHPLLTRGCLFPELAGTHLFYDLPSSANSPSAIAHAVSPDRLTWTPWPLAIRAADHATLHIGSVVSAFGGYWMYFLEIQNAPQKQPRQRVLLANSSDLIRWDPYPANPLIHNVSSSFASVSASTSPASSHWSHASGPFVLPHPSKPLWLMHITQSCQPLSSPLNPPLTTPLTPLTRTLTLQSADLLSWQVSDTPHTTSLTFPHTSPPTAPSSPTEVAVNLDASGAILHIS